jgi:hypothetical protein
MSIYVTGAGFFSYIKQVANNLQILGNGIGNSAMSRSGDFIKKSLKIPKGQI